MNNSRIVWEYRLLLLLDLLSGRFISVSLVGVPEHSKIPGNCRTIELARTSTLLPESSSIELGMPLASVKLDILSGRQPILGQ